MRTMWSTERWYERGLIGAVLRALDRRPVPLTVRVDRGPLPSGPVVFHPSLRTAAEVAHRR
jgi:hypothetical protein